MATFTSIRAKIKTLLEGIAEVAFVADFHDPNLKEFPAVTFDVSDEEGEFLTNKENLRTITYTIVVYQEVDVIKLSDATRILDVVADKIINAFENDFNLSGEVDWCMPLAGPRGQFEASPGTVMFQELNLQCRFTILTT